MFTGKHIFPYFIALCCLITLSAVFVDADAASSGHYVQQDGVLYFVSADRADALSIIPDAEIVMFRGTIEGKPVFMEDGLTMTSKHAKRLILEEGLRSVPFIRLEKWDHLETIDIYMETEFLQDVTDYAFSHIRFIDCPRLQSVRIHGEQNKDGSTQEALRISAMRCPSLSEISIANGYNRISINAESGELLATCTLPASAEYINIPTSATLQLDPQNPYYEVVDDVLIHLQTQSIELYPQSKTDAHYTVPDGIQRITIENSALESLSLPESIQFITLSCENLSQISMPDSNASFRLIDGVLFSADMETLAYYPEGRRDSSYTTPQNALSSIRISNRYLQSLTIPQINDSSYFTLTCTSLQTIELPANYVYSKYHFDHPAEVGHLRAIIMASSNASNRSINGAIYSADGKELLYVPPGTEGTFIIEEGTETVRCELYDYDGTATPYHGAFTGAQKIEKIVFPSSMKALNGKLIEQCSALSELSVAKDNPYFISRDGAILSKDGTTLVAIALGNRSHITLPSGIETVGPDALPSNDTLKSITIPYGVHTLAEGALSSNIALERISLPQTLCWVKEDAFLDCVNLQHIAFPEGLQSLGAAFTLSNSMAYELGEDSGDIVLPKKVISLPASLVSIDYNAFSFAFRGAGYTESPSLVEVTAPSYHSYASIYAHQMHIPLRVQNDPQLYNPAPDVYTMLLAKRWQKSIPLLPPESARYTNRAYGMPGDMVSLHSGDENGLSAVYTNNTSYCVSTSFVGPTTTIVPLSRTGILTADTMYGHQPTAQTKGNSQTIQKGTFVHVTRAIGPWYGIVDSSNQWQSIYYIHASHVQLLSLANGGREATLYTEDITTLVPHYALPQEDAPLLGEHFAGTVVEVLYDDGIWAMVQFDRFTRGFVQSDTLQEASALKTF